MHRDVNPCAAVLIAGFCGTTTAYGQGVPPDYGYAWATIDRPGNRAATREELNGWPLPVSVGNVDYTYRIAKTEVTAGDWLDFVRAYSKHNPGQGFNDELTGDFVRASTPNPRPEEWYLAGQGLEPVPTNMGWRFAARYCNWLHHDKADAAWAFESGAYDTSTFTVNPDGTYNDQLVHSDGARFWIPTRNEWDKAMYYDPNRYGDDIGGYWRFPTSSDLPPISGLPGEGGQTNAGNGAGEFFPLMPVGSYTNVTSPWGLFDGSGGVSEWLEDIAPEGERAARGNGAGGFVGVEAIDVFLSARVTYPFNGMRLASVPEPMSVALGTIGLVLSVSKRRRQS